GGRSKSVAVLGRAIGWERRVTVFPATLGFRPTCAVDGAGSRRCMVHTFCPTRTRSVRNELSHFIPSNLVPPSCGPKQRGAETACCWISGRATLSATNARQFAPLARLDDEPAFDEPWQAQILALAFTLTQAGLFTPVDWSDALGAELRSATERGEPDDHTTYYAAALAALEHL